MDRSLGEHAGLARVDGVEHEAGAVLANGTRGQGAVDGVENLRRTGVGVGGIHAARSGVAMLAL